MPWKFVFCAALALLPTCATVTNATPVLSFPINSQVPPIARCSLLYSYTFSNSTFDSDAGPITYELFGQPSWLYLQQSTRTLSGMPGLQDVGPTTFELIASDQNGSLSSSVTLVVVDRTGPRIAEPLLTQLASVGRTSPPASLLLHPLQVFSFSLSRSTFLNTSANTHYYAVSADHSPLPSWVQFDSESTSFSGTSPPLLSPTATPQEFTIVLIASEVVGFSEAETIFQIVVGYHILAFAQPQYVYNVSRGLHFDTPKLRNRLLLDGVPIASEELLSVSSDAPDWMTFDSNGITLSGAPPDNSTTTNILVRAADAFGDVANVSITLVQDDRGLSSIFTGNIPDINLTMGQSFSYSIASMISQRSGQSFSADLGNCSSWLRFNPIDLTLSGVVPRDVRSGETSITITGKDGSDVNHWTFKLSILPDISSNILSATSWALPQSKTSQATVSQSTPSTQSTNAFRSIGKDVKIVLSVVLPIVCILVVACLYQVFFRRRRHRVGKENEENSDLASGVQAEIGLPPFTKSIANKRHDEEAGQLSGPGGRKPPRVELRWAPDSFRMAKNRLSRQQMQQRQGFGSSSESSWSNFVASNTHKPPADTAGQLDNAQTSQEIPVAKPASSLAGSSKTFCPRSPLRSINSRKRRPSPRRASKAMGAMSSLGPGLPQRLSGAGHGSGGAGLEHLQRSSWQTTLNSMAAGESKATTHTLEEETSAEVPIHQPKGKGKGSATTDKRLKSTVINRGDNRRIALEEQRQQWHTQRARDRLEGLDRFSKTWCSTSHSLYALPEKSPLPLREISSNKTQTQSGLSQRAGTQRWSKWSAIGPAAQEFHGEISTLPTPSASPERWRQRRENRLSSEGQYESAESSDVDWEDDNLEPEDNLERRREHVTRRINLESASLKATRPKDQTPRELERSKGSLMAKSGLIYEDVQVDSEENYAVDTGAAEQRGSLRFI